MGLDMYIQDEYGNEVAYWRKFNALHNWFVKNVQDGVDECQTSRRLTKEDIEQIIYILKAVKQAPLTAQVLLPPTQGLFFGSTQIDKYFLEDVESAIPKFERILEDVDREKYYYHSSW